jgi:hypothetical protein
MVLTRQKLFYSIREFVVLVIVGFFAYTLVNKLLQFEAFKLNIARTGLFERYWVNVVAYFAIVAEIASISLLVFARKWGIRFALAMMLSFTLYIIYLASTGHYEVCGCGGVLNGLKFQWHLLINLVLFFILLLYALYYRTPSSAHKKREQSIT